MKTIGSLIWSFHFQSRPRNKRQKEKSDFAGVAAPTDADAKSMSGEKTRPPRGYKVSVPSRLSTFELSAFCCVYKDIRDFFDIDLVATGISYSIITDGNER